MTGILDVGSSTRRVITAPKLVAERNVGCLRDNFNFICASFVKRHSVPRRTSNELAVSFDVVVVGNAADIHFAQSSWLADEVQKVTLILRNQRDCFPKPDIHCLHWEQGRLPKPVNNLTPGPTLLES